MKKISYILVAYKSNDTVAAAIESVLQQTGDFDKEIIVVDNYSRAGCSGIVMTLAPAARIMVNARNVGYTHAINQGIDLATGDYLFYLNPDVRLAVDCTAILVAELESNARVAAAAPQLRYDDGSLQYSVRNFPTFSTLIYEHTGLARLFRRNPRYGKWKNRYFDHEIRAEVNQPMASAFLLRREVQATIGPWDERFFLFFSDVDICRRIIDAGYRIVFNPSAKAQHGAGGSTRKEGGWIVFSSHRSFYRYLAKYELKGRKAILRLPAAVILSISAVIRAIYRESISIATS